MKDLEKFDCELNPFDIIPTHSSVAISQRYMNYTFAMQFCADKVVADVSCGTMYGSSLLSMRAKKLTCVNINEKAINFGLRNFKFYCPVETKVLDLDINGLKIFNLDVMISFETIEHLEKPDKFLKDIKNSLNPGGVFIFSLPRTPKTIYHKHEIRTLEDAKAIVSPYFKNIKWYFQANDIITDVEFKTASNWIGVAREG